MPSLIAILGLDMSRFSAGLHEAGREALSMGKEIGSHFGSLLTFAGIEESARRTIEWGKSLKQMSEQAGVSVEFMQGVSEVWEHLGSSGEDVTNAITILSRKIGEARMGADEAQKVFKKWGIEIRGLSIEDVFYNVSDKMRKMQDPALRNALALDLMGRNAREMGAGMSFGAAELRKMVSEVDKLSGSQIENLRKVDIKLEELSHKWKLLWGGILTHAMEGNPAPFGREDEVRTIMAELARIKGITPGDTQTTWIGALTGSNQRALKLRAQLREEAIDIVKKMHAEVPASTAAGVGATAKETEKLLRLEEQLYKLKVEENLAGMTQREQLAELYRIRQRIVAIIGQSSPEGKLQAKIDIEEIDQKRRRVADEMARGGKRWALDLNQSQRIGAYSAMVNTQVDTATIKSEEHLRKIKVILDADSRRAAQGAVF